MRHFDEAISAWMGFRRDTGDHLKLALQADPDFLMGHVTRGCFLKLFAVRALDKKIDDAIRAARQSALEGGATQRERDHIAALSAWHNNDWQSALHSNSQRRAAIYPDDRGTCEGDPSGKRDHILV